MVVVEVSSPTPVMEMDGIPPGSTLMDSTETGVTGEQYISTSNLDAVFLLFGEAHANCEKSKLVFTTAIYQGNTHKFLAEKIRRPEISSLEELEICHLSQACCAKPIRYPIIKGSPICFSRFPKRCTPSKNNYGPKINNPSRVGQSPNTALNQSQCGHTLTFGFSVYYEAPAVDGPDLLKVLGDFGTNGLDARSLSEPFPLLISIQRSDYWVVDLLPPQFAHSLPFGRLQIDEAIDLSLL
ncbi:hypothetical protein FF38_09736 [Lucilia cuprina]|uniref:Uncharacterized protein n=1 Tax=Lucilia cuprina TaxID=7375 RepID=A0A0L0CG76_LUCCU|nr:hypothetical protein FF38_09736 [Lucilia cuprina]